MPSISKPSLGGPVRHQVPYALPGILAKPVRYGTGAAIIFRILRAMSAAPRRTIGCSSTRLIYSDRTGILQAPQLGSAIRTSVRCSCCRRSPPLIVGPPHSASMLSTFRNRRRGLHRYRSSPDCKLYGTSTRNALSDMTRLRDHPPGATRAQHVEDGVHDLARRSPRPIRLEHRLI
jgi:hypothetical protein